MYPIGGFGIQVRGDISYFQMEKSDSVQGWRKKWFYVTCDQGGLPEFIANKPLKKTNACVHLLSKDERATVKPLISSIATLLKSLGKEVGGVHLIATFVRMQVQPLHARVHPMWKDEDPSDPSQTSSTELADEEVVPKVKAITSFQAADSCNIDCPVTPYGVNHQLPEVMFFSSLQLQLYYYWSLLVLLSHKWNMGFP